MKHEIKPVEGPCESAGAQHPEFLHDVGRAVWGKTQGEAEKDGQAPRELGRMCFHTLKIPQQLPLNPVARERDLRRRMGEDILAGGEG